MNASATLTWHSKVRERTENEVAESLAAKLRSDSDNVHEDDVKSTGTVTITVVKATIKGGAK